MTNKIKRTVSLIICLFIFSVIIVTPLSYTALAAPAETGGVVQNVGIVLQVGERGYLLSAYVLDAKIKGEYNDYRKTLDSSDASIKLVSNGKGVALRDYVLRKSSGQGLAEFLNDETKSSYFIPKENYENIVVRTRTGYVLLDNTAVDGWDVSPQDPAVTATFTPDSLLGEGFMLGKITANVKGVTGAAKYAVKYSVSNDTETKYVTTSKVNNGQPTTDLIQYKDAETIIDILVFDSNNNELSVFKGVTITIK